MTVTGDGSQARSIQYVDDLVEGCRQLRRLPGWAPTVDVADGLRQTIEWFLECLGLAVNPRAVPAC